MKNGLRYSRNKPTPPRVARGKREDPMESFFNIKRMHRENEKKEAARETKQIIEKAIEENQNATT